MTISIWRYSHLTLAISSALFIIIASLTGIILAFEPISNKLKLYSVEDINSISIAETISVLQNKYDEVITIEIDENEFVLAEVITREGKSERFYINPKTGEKIGNLSQKNALFEFATNLHRSLFLKSTGRFLIGFVSLLLLLIASSGIILIIKRQGGVRKFFSKIIKEDFNQYYHIVFGRYFLVPIIIITLTGIYLSLEKFSLLPKDNSSHRKLEIYKTNITKNLTDFDFFKSTRLKDIKKIEFPFSSDKEDYFFVKTINNEFAIDQFNLQKVSYKKQPLTVLGAYYSLILHTGKGSIIWSIILMLTCFSILFFIFSGFYMTLKRKKKTTSIIDKNEKDEAEFIILVGSETGSTFHFATAFKKALIKANKRVFLTELNDYTTYNKAKNIIVFTATYGDGEAPANANKFFNLVNKITPINNISYSVLGFGSKEYPAFCEYAILVHTNLQNHQWFSPIVPLFKIDDQDLNSFENWINEWSLKNATPIEVDKNHFLENEKIAKFKVSKTNKLNIDDTFLIELKPQKRVKFSSGDILSIIPKGENKSRMYSIAKVNSRILLSIKKHESGACSSYLSQMKTKQIIEGTIITNKNFHFSKKQKDVILIANGTGIAPFLGMIEESKKANVHLFWGGRTQKSFEIYKKHIDKSINNKTLTSFSLALSQEYKEKIYVQDVLEQQSELVSKILKKGGVIFICGSLIMQKRVEEVINKIGVEKLNLSLKKLKENNQIKTDCY